MCADSFEPLTYHKPDRGDLPEKLTWANTRGFVAARDRRALKPLHEVLSSAATVE